MNNFLLSVVVLSSLVTMSSCKEKEVVERENIVMHENVLSLEESEPKELLKILTHNEDLLRVEYTEWVANEVIKVFDHVNSFKEWTQVSTIDLTTENGSGIAKLYYNKELQVEQIVVRKYEEEKQSLDVYYFNEDKLVLVINQSLLYNANPDSKEFNIEESEYTKECNYFVDGKLYSIMSNLDCGAPFAEEYIREVESDILKEVKSLIP